MYREPKITFVLGAILTERFIIELATTFHELEAEKDVLRSDPEKLAVLFKEMIQMCLW